MLIYWKSSTVLQDNGDGTRLGLTYYRIFDISQELDPAAATRSLSFRGEDRHIHLSYFVQTIPLTVCPYAIAHVSQLDSCPLAKNMQAYLYYPLSVFPPHCELCCESLLISYLCLSTLLCLTAKVPTHCVIASISLLRLLYSNLSPIFRSTRDPLHIHIQPRRLSFRRGCGHNNGLVVVL